MNHFVCNFDPVIFQITDTIALRWYGVAYLLGFLAVVYFSLWQAKIKQLKISKSNLTDLIFWIFVIMVISARIGYMLFYDIQNLQNTLYIWQGGMSFHGGFIGVIIACIFLSKKYKITLLQLGDLLILPSFIAITFGRLANFMNCEIWGRVADLPWAIIFPYAGQIPRHPAQLYGAGLYFLAFLALLFYAKSRPIDGKIMFLGMILFGAIRIINEFFRRADYYVTDWLTIGQLLSIPLVLGGILGLMYIKNKK